VSTIETRRVALVRYAAPDGTQCVGSGFLMNDHAVLTADHIANGSDHKVDFRGQPCDVARVLRSGSEHVDLAILSLRDPIVDVSPLGCARIDRNNIGLIRDCFAIGFPRWKQDGATRRAAEVHGTIPTGEGLEATVDDGLQPGFLTLVGDRTPAMQSQVPQIGTAAAWGGMSGAVVIAGTLAVGVVRSVSTAGDGCSLTVTPLTAIENLPDHERQREFWVALSVRDPAGLPQAGRGAWLGAYLTAARTVAHQHPYTIAQSGAPALTAVYLRQQVAFHVDQPTSPAVADLRERLAPIDPEGAVPLRLPEHLLQDRNARSTADQITQVIQRFDVRDVLQSHPCGLIVGGPGSGKSSLMRSLVETTAGNWLDGRPGAFVPALINAQTLLQPISFQEAVAGALRKDLGTTLDNVDLDTFLADSPLPGIPWLILLDGLDEIFDAGGRQRVIEIIKRWQNDIRYRFLVASRPLPGHELQALRSSDFPVFEIQPFTDEQLPMLARSWFSALGLSDMDHVVEQFIGQLKRIRIAQLARNPLIATIACVLFADSPGRELPRSRTDLYAQFVSQLLRKLFSQGGSLDTIKDRHGEVARDVLINNLRGIIEELAVRRISDSGKSIWSDVEQLSERYRPSQVHKDLWPHVVAELLRQSGLISDRFDDLAFSHDTIMEYLAACSRITSFRPRVHVHERWRLVARAGRNESSALFMVALLHSHGTDLTRRIPAFLPVCKLLHARLVAAMAHDGCDLEPRVVRNAIDRLSAIATMKTNSIPYILRRGPWLTEDDCVMAAKSLMMLDKAQGLNLLVRLAADPTVAGLNIFDVFAERMLTEDLTDVDPGQGLLILSEIALVQGDNEADSLEEGFTRLLIARFVYQRDANAGLKLIKALAKDQTMNMSYRIDCVNMLAVLDRAGAIEILVSLVNDVNAEFHVRLDRINDLLLIDQPSALATLEHLASNSANSDFVRVVAATKLGRYARAVGVSAPSELSYDRYVSVFHRVYHYARSSTEFDRIHRLAEISADPTLPGKWRLFAADELAGCDAERWLSVLSALKEDPSLDRWTRIKASMRIVIYRWAPQVVEVPETKISYPRSRRLELRSFIKQLGELTMLAARRGK
jgi:hypothetical protein